MKKKIMKFSSTAVCALALACLSSCVTTGATSASAPKAAEEKKEATKPSVSLAGRTYSGEQTWTQYTVSFKNDKECSYSFMSEPPEQGWKGTYKFSADGKTVICTFTPPSFYLNGNGEVMDYIEDEEASSFDMVLKSDDNFDSLKFSVYGDEVVTVYKSGE